jgi:hypothetical protein
MQQGGQIARPSPKRKEHLLLVAETQMGKTSMGLQMIVRRHQNEMQQLGQAVTRWSIFDPKKTFWLGLESVLDQDGKPCVIHPRYSQPETILAVLERLQYLVQVMEHRQDYRWRCHAKGMQPEPARPRIVVLEEWITCVIYRDGCNFLCWRSFQ